MIYIKNYYSGLVLFYLVFHACLANITNNSYVFLLYKIEKHKRTLGIDCQVKLTTFREAIQAVYPNSHSQVQRCIIHMLRNSFNMYPTKT